MPPSPFANDALWKCLCPSYQLTRTLRTSLRPRPSLTACNVRAQHPTASCTASQITQLRRFSIASETNHASSSLNSKPEQPQAPFFKKRDARPEKPSLVHLPTLELYERLRSDGAAGRHNEVMNIIKILVKDRRERPNIRMYSAILHSYTNSEEGTGGKIRKVLDEMKDVGIDLDVAACHNVLEALAVHPDYILREEVLEYMKERWFSLNDRGHNMVVAGLLRDRLFEQAIEKIEDMVRQQITINDWLWDKATWTLLDYSEVEEAWQLMLLRQRSTTGSKSFSRTLLGHFLDVAAKMCHVEGVTTIWEKQVGPDYITPATATCLNVLNVASRVGDTTLATDVFRILSDRKTIFTSHHYEMLLETYLNAKDLNAALSVVLIMAESGIKTDENNLHPLFTHLRQQRGAPTEALQMLQSYETEGRKVPTAAINACIQAAIHLEDLEEAIEIYKVLHTVSRAGPNTQTFNILFQGCHKAGRKELAMFLASEMVERGIEPDAMTYDRLVLVCCHSGDVQDAFSYYEEMRSMAFEPRRGCFEILIDKGVEVGDSRTPRVLEDMKSCGHVPKKETVRSVGNRFVNKKELEGSSGGKDGFHMDDERIA